MHDVSRASSRDNARSSSRIAEGAAVRKKKRHSLSPGTHIGATGTAVCRSPASALSFLGLFACSGAPPSDLVGPSASAATDMQGGDNERATDASAGGPAASSPAAE